MAEENDPVEPQGGGGEPVTDWKAEARKWGKPPAGPMDLLVLRAIRSCRAIESRKR